MAKLEQITESLNIKLSENDKIQINTEKPTGQKRRSWLFEEESNPNKEAYRPHKLKRSIDHNKHDSSTPFIIPIDQPYLNTGSIKGGYKHLDITLEKLRGNPLKITQYIFEISKDGLDKITNKITQTDVMKNLGMSKDSARTGMRFLLKTKVVERVDFKIGKGGWSKYKLKESILNELTLGYEKGIISPFKIIPYIQEQKGFNSSNNITNTITTQNSPLLEWESLDISPLEHIGFNKTHLFPLKTKNSPSIVQESINHFAFALKHNEKYKKHDNPLNVIMGVLRKGEGWYETNYRSPQEIAQEKFLKHKKAERERIKALEEEAIKLAFEEWKDSLNVEEMSKIIENKKEMGAIPKDVKLRIYFRENVWEQMKKDYLL